MPRPELENGLRNALHSLRDYLGDLVLVGGWVPYLQLTYGRALSPDAQTSLTAEADLLVPSTLERGQREAIAAILEAAAFRRSGDSGIVWIREPERGETIEFLRTITGPASNRGRSSEVPDQPRLRALALDQLWMLEAFTERLILPPSTEDASSLGVLVPLLGAFVLNKANTFNLRAGVDGPAKAAKDVLYLRDIMAAGDRSVAVVRADLTGILGSSSRPRAIDSVRRAGYHLRTVAPRFHGIAGRILEARDGAEGAAARADVEGHLADLIELMEACLPNE